MLPLGWSKFTFISQISKRQLCTTIEYLFILTTMLITFLEGEEEKTLARMCRNWYAPILLVGMSNNASLLEKFVVPQKTHTGWPGKQTIPLLEMYSRELRAETRTDNVHCSSIHSHKREEMHMYINRPVNRQVEQQNAIHTHNGLWVGHKKKENSDTYDGRDKPWKHMLSEISWLLQDWYCIIVLTWGL